MSISVNIHRTTSVALHEDSGEKAKWVMFKFNNKDGLSHDITVFDITLYDIVNACEKALHKRQDDGYSI